MKITNLTGSAWSVETAAPAKTARGRQRGSEPADVLPKSMLPAGAVIAAAGSARPGDPTATRRAVGAAPPPLELSVETDGNDRVVLAVRLPSGALRFVAPVERGTRGAKATGSASRFIIRPPRAAAQGKRRGLISDAIQWVVVKIGEEVVDAVIGKAVFELAKVAETAWWGDRTEGLFRVSSAGQSLKLQPVKREQIKGPALLLLHGTFSNAEAAFNDLLSAPGDFFAEARQHYGDHIYAWNHFTVSKSPEENAREFLESLPKSGGGIVFDVITHSRGGLVLRTLVERADELVDLAARFTLRNAVLVASPNAGTPLATPDRWEETLGFVANVTELFTPNPWAMGAKFVADGLVWLAARAAGDLPGLGSMDRDGETISALQDSGLMTSGSYSALAANFHPSGTMAQRLLDAGVDAFFQGANDLVVPAEGSWLADGAGLLIPAERIGCFGAGGNLHGEESVHHLNFFKQAGTVDFITQALGLRSMPAAPEPLDPTTILPTRTMLNIITRRGGGTRSFAATRSSAPGAPAAKPLSASGLAMPQRAYADTTLHLMILEAPVDETSDEAAAKSRPAKLMLATYSNARVLEPFPTKNPPNSPAGAVDTPGSRFEKIIDLDKKIRACLDGTAVKKSDDEEAEVPELPNEDELGDLGEWLFRALFIGDVRRLYDAARAEQAGRPLNIVLTCGVPWIAALPWEFAYDPMRRKYLASEEVHFTRGVMAGVPAETISRRGSKLRILVITAQPSDVNTLSIEEEEERIRHAFRSLTATALVEIDVLTDASPSALQEHIMGEQVQGRSYDVVHFISHGEFEPGAEEGKLLLVGSDGATQELEVRPLREMLTSRGIHLVFLNACESAVGFRPHAKGDAAAAKLSARRQKRGARGIAQSLVEGGLPAVVANQYTVLDSSALGFAECFYRALALGASLGQAAREARIALNYAIDGDAIDWAVPVLYARDPDICLCAPSHEAVRQAPARRRSASRKPDESIMRGGGLEAGGVIRVGIADISKFFPQIADILVTLNAAQTAFEFVPVDVAIPLGVWESKDWGPEEGGKIRYLRAERFGEKLKERPKRLGVHYLICATNHMMRWDDAYNIYGWWSGSKDCRVLLFSTGGLALSRDGEEAGRVVANAIVQALAAQIPEEAGAPDQIHETGPKSCPFYYNEERLEESVSGRNKFDPNCQRYLEKYVPETLNQVPRAEIIAAFDHLLTAFDPSSARG